MRVNVTYLLPINIVIVFFIASAVIIDYNIFITKTRNASVHLFLRKSTITITPSL